MILANFLRRKSSRLAFSFFLQKDSSSQFPIKDRNARQDDRPREKNHPVLIGLANQHGALKHQTSSSIHILFYLSER